MRLGLEPTDRRIDLDQIMQRWVDAGARFSDETRAVYSKAARGRPRLHRCAHCQFGQFKPIVVGDDGFYAGISAQNYYNDEKWEFDRAFAIITAQRAASVVDIGCGSGMFLGKLAALPQMQCAGVEINEAAAASARARGLDVRICNFTQQAITGAPSADVITAFQVLEHVKNPIAMLKSLRALVHDDGLVLVGVPDTEGLISRHLDALTEIPPHHVTYWTEASLRSAMSRVGLEIVRLEREPLSKALWDGYLPDVWEEGGWPAHYGRVAAKLAGAPGDGMLWIANVLNAAGMTTMHGVGGHSMLAVARPAAIPSAQRKAARDH